MEAAAILVKTLVEKLVNYKGDWLRENRGSLKTVAALIVTITFQPAIAPPGGVWQNRTYPKYTNSTQMASVPPNAQTDEDCYSQDGCLAGTSILANYSYRFFKPFIVFDTVSFMAALVVLFLLIIGLPRQNKLSMWILTITVCISLSALGFAFLFGMFCVLPDDDTESFLNLGEIERWTVFIWLGLVAIGTLIMVVLVLRQLIYKYFVQKRFGGEKDDRINQEELQGAEEP